MRLQYFKGQQIIFLDPNGAFIEVPKEIDEMMFPVLCSCGKVYDIGALTKEGNRLHRYTDCDQWTTPCCGRITDNRPWAKNYQEIEKIE
jgi:hypothetical protein